MALCKVTGTLYLPTGALAGDYAIFLQRTDKRVTADYLGSVVPQMVRVLTSQTGTVDFDILTGTYRGVARPSNMAGTTVGYEFSFEVPDAATAQFKNCIDAIAPAQPTPLWLKRIEDAVADAESAAAAAETAAGQAAGGVAAEAALRTAADAAERLAAEKMFDDLARLSVTTHVGDEFVLARSQNGVPMTYWENDVLVTKIGTANHPHVGDPGIPFLTDLLGRALGYVTSLGEVMLPGLILTPAHVGDPVIIMGDANEQPVMWYQNGVLDGLFAEDSGGGGTTITRPIPTFAGNAWQVIDDGDSIRFLSDAYQGRVMGFEERERVVIGETSPVAVGIIAYGGGMGIVRQTPPESWRWHNFDRDMRFSGGWLAAEAQAVAAQMVASQRYGANPTAIHITQAVGSPIESDTEVGSAAYNAVLSDLSAARTALVAWDKELIVDRICMSLLGGAPSTSEIVADAEYAAIAQEMRGDVVEVTGQQQPVNCVVVSQSIGTRVDGTSTVALAEAKLDYMHPTMGFVVASPRHPFALEPGTQATLTAQAALMLSELEAVAVDEREAGREWFCPRLQSAVRSGNTITATFIAMTDLVLGTAHGFTLSDDSNGVTITNVTVAGKVATVTLSGAPSEGAYLCIAWGRTGDPGDGYAANRTTLRDQFSRASVLVPSATLYRFALSMRVHITS